MGSLFAGVSQTLNTMIFSRGSDKRTRAASGMLAQAAEAALPRERRQRRGVLRKLAGKCYPITVFTLGVGKSAYGIRAFVGTWRSRRKTAYGFPFLKKYVQKYVVKVGMPRYSMLRWLTAVWPD